MPLADSLIVYAPNVYNVAEARFQRYISVVDPIGSYRKQDITGILTDRAGRPYNVTIVI